MRKQARSNRTIHRPTPSVRNTTFDITRSLIAMMITGINSCAALLCSTEGKRIHSCIFRSASRYKYIAVQNLLFLVLAIHWRLTHLLRSLAYFKTQPLILNSTNIFYTQAVFMLSINFFFSFPRLLDYNIYKKIQRRKGKTIFFCRW